MVEVLLDNLVEESLVEMVGALPACGVLRLWEDALVLGMEALQADGCQRGAPTRRLLLLLGRSPPAHGGGQ